MEVSKSPADGLAKLASGIEAGTIGGIAMLMLLVSSSLLSGRAWFEVPNLLGSTFYRTRAFRQGVGLATLSGTALHFVITGIIGGAFGLVCARVQERRRLILLGMGAGFFWYYFADAVFWSRVNPLVPLYSPQPATLLAHALFGACLGFMGRDLGANTERSDRPLSDSPLMDRSQEHLLPVQPIPVLMLDQPVEPLTREPVVSAESAAEPLTDALE